MLVLKTTFLFVLIVLEKASCQLAEEVVVNPHDFKYLLNPGAVVCNKTSDPDLFLLVYVHTAPSHFKQRQAIRETWLRRSMFQHTRLVFMMGATIEKNLQLNLQLEAGLYNDIVQEDFFDSYRNLTYKGIMAMKWIAQYCSQVEFILKVDDDIVANPFLLLTHLDHFRQHKIIKERTIMCLVWQKMKVVRNVKSKWYVSKDEFEPDFFSRYCSGSAYLLSSDLPAIMYNRSFYVKFFWVDDFYITGLLANASNATLEFYNSLYALSALRLTSDFKGKRGDSTLFGHLSKSAPTSMYAFWKLMLKRKLANVHLRPKDFTTFDRFKYIEDFYWSRDIWKEFYEFNEDYFY